MLTQHGPVVLIPQLRYSDQITNVVDARAGAAAKLPVAVLHAATVRVAVLVVVKSDCRLFITNQI
jgi:hypothetical protein